MYIHCYLDTLETKAIVYTHMKTQLHFSMNGFWSVGSANSSFDGQKESSPQKMGKNFFRKEQINLLVQTSDL